MYETEQPCGKCAGRKSAGSYYDQPYEPSPTRIANAYPGAATAGEALIWALVGAAVGFGIAMVVLEVPAKTAYARVKSKARKYWG